MDVDLRHPSVHRDLGHAARPGPGRVHGRRAELDEVIVHDEETGLHYLPIRRQTGQPDRPPGQPEDEAALFAQLRERFDFIVMDSAPLLGVTDTKVRLALRRQGAVRDALGQDQPRTRRSTRWPTCARSRRNVAGVVLTQVDVTKHAQYGYGDVGQYYGKYQKYYVN